MKRKTYIGALAAGGIATAVGLVAVSTQSLWIDEANSAVKAMAHDWPTFVAAMQKERGSDLQMPLYMFMLWAWEKVFGHSEFALRAMNVPLFAAALAVVGGCWNATVVHRVFFVLFACSSAFLWAYLDEARPYILQFLGATMCVIAMANVAGSPKPVRSSDIILFVLGMTVLCGSSLFGAVSGFWFTAGFALLCLKKQSVRELLPRKDLRTAAAAGLPILLALGVFYYWTLAVGAKASSVGKTGGLNVAHAIYELSGMAGLGPSRTELRESPAAIIPFAPILATYVCLVGVLISAWSWFVIHRRYGLSAGRSSWMMFWLTAIATLGSTFLVGIFGDFRVVGRHTTPVLPFFLMLFSMAAAILCRRDSGTVARMVTRVAIFVMLSSAMSYRLAARHAKDDYRAAAEFARQAIEKGGSVWWAADRSAAHFYGLKTTVHDGISTAEPLANGAFMANNRETAYLADLPYPSLVIFSKTDVYDRGGTLRCWLEENQYELVARKPAFFFYQKLADKL